MLTIHGRATSGNVQPVMWAVAELELPHRRLDVGGVFGGTDTPEFRAMNPNGLVPVLQDSELTLFESGAILRYLGATYGDEDWWPRDPRVRAPLDQWAEWAKVTLWPAVALLFNGLVRTPPARRDAARLSTLAAEAGRLARMIDARLGAGPFLSGTRPGFADMTLGALLYRYYTLEFERPGTPSLDAYYARLTERPAYREHAMVSYESLRVRD